MREQCSSGGYTKVYLAAAWSRREEILGVAEELKKLGVVITSRWLTEEQGLQTRPTPGFLRERAYIDLADVAASDVLVRFTDTLETMGAIYDESEAAWVPVNFVTGARHDETGYALGLGKTVFVVGGRQNIFDYLDRVIHLKDVEELKQRLDPR